MSDSIASPPLGHSTCLFGSGETDCHSGLWSSLSREGGREGGRNREERKKAGEGEKIDQIIGASLSEPHTSVTALHTHVCMLVGWFVCWFGPTTYRKF